MIDDNTITISIAPIACYFNSSISSCINRCTGRCTEIKTRMKLDCFINGINTVTKTGSDPFKIGVAHRLNSRCGGQQFFFIQYHSMQILIRCLLHFNTACHIVKRCHNRIDDITLFHSFYLGDLLFLFHFYQACTIGYRVGFKYRTVHFIVSCLQLFHLRFDLFCFPAQLTITVFQAFIFCTQQFFIGRANKAKC